MKVRSKVADQTYIIGVDGGGTKCRARLYSSQSGFLASGLSGPANPVRGLNNAMHSVVEACERAIQNSGIEDLPLSEVHVGLGLAGVNLETVNKKVLDWPHPFKSRYLTTDLHIACLGANDTDEGAVMIIGTGSCGLSVSQQKMVQLGGHGFPIGDYAGGAWIGFEAIRYVLRSLDGVAKNSKMNAEVLSQLDCENATQIAEKMLHAKPSEFAALTPMVFDLAESGDEAAAHIIKQGAAQISALARKLLAEQPTRLSMIGGVSERIKNWLDEDVAYQIQPPIYQPDIGAVFFAQKHLDLSEK
ncbi:N-acetylglucosamine kinase [Catenovulum sediminis]|uniref:N-acetylglucosamine kinase n=1 Tax=Catenovulum sediminis TaxID=1740262 RepID=UPI001FE5AEAB|nr:BadF/BadG/BcrA/BcrD ATPase family protein [Catenovulum sediminis]